MSNRLTSEFFVSALMRQVQGVGAFAYLERRGSAEAGAIAIKIEREDRLVALLLPAPQSTFSTKKPEDRIFEIAMSFQEAIAINERLLRLLKYDPDLWVISIEDKHGRYFVDIIE